MLNNVNLLSAAQHIQEQFVLNDVDQYCSETGICKADFIVIEPTDFDGDIYAIDGSNIVVCDWSVAHLNRIRAGYVVYKGRNWQRTVITYDDIFWADPRNYAEPFDHYLKDFFGLNGITFEESDLDRLSSYFRELQEYVALADAIDEAQPRDLVLYDGSFDIFEPLRDILKQILRSAEEKRVDLIGISKSSSLSWGNEISLPFVKHTSFVGSQLMPNVPWYLSLKNKNVDCGPGKWDGETFVARFDGQSTHAFRADVPSYISDRISALMGMLCCIFLFCRVPGLPSCTLQSA